ncbi:VTT domain-containing protein [Methyloligella sp. 2.7D]|uniref:TVP38/TMEM64 family protein n=1 Tax=unclassified Methyloligella TaxID=2625955 RepID=UPI00157BBC07|nr:VTT domain-containing protein [Methyloligella sp. GL2]QKP76552.1 VTT domain-containing protein [Methyloligella sp. GL2]
MAPDSRRDKAAKPGRRAVKYALLFLTLIAIVIVPFLLFGTSLEAWTFGLIAPERSAPVIATAGIALLLVDVLLPIPSTFVAAGLGAMLGAPLGIAITAIGLTAGCGVGFLLGRLLGRDLAERELGLADYRYLATMLRRYGLPVLALCRPVPVLAEASIIAAGIMGMRPGRVLAVTGLANLGFAGVYAGLGATAEGMGGFLLAFAASLAIPGIALLVARYVQRRHEQTVHEQTVPAPSEPDAG